MAPEPPKTPFVLNQRAINLLGQLSTTTTDFWIDGVVFDAGANMLMSCRGISNTTLTIHLHGPPEDEKATALAFTTYRTFENKTEVSLSNNIRIWLSAEVYTQFIEEEFRRIEINVINPDLNHLLFYAQMN